MIAPASLDAHAALRAEMTFCSWQAGWRSLLLRAYVDPENVEELVTAPTDDHLVVLVTSGSCDIESRGGGRWLGTTYRAGHIGMVAPRDQAQLRWRSAERHGTLQVHLPAAIMAEAADELDIAPAAVFGTLSCLSQLDTAVASTLLALESAARQDAPDLYAETAARFLALHVLARRGRVLRPSPRPRAQALTVVEDFMRAHLPMPLSLAQLAAVAGLSRFQLLREARIAWNETPLRRLTRLRMEHARYLLAHSTCSIIEIAFECGYGNPAHFATAFRRLHGVSPSTLRR